MANNMARETVPAIRETNPRTAQVMVFNPAKDREHRMEPVSEWAGRETVEAAGMCNPEEGAVARSRISPAFYATNSRFNIHR